MGNCWITRPDPVSISSISSKQVRTDLVLRVRSAGVGSGRHACQHQSLNYSTLDAVYRTASGGGASIVDKFTEREKTHSETEVKRVQRRSAVGDRLPF